MWLLLLACTPVSSDTSEDAQVLAVFDVEVSDDPGSVFTDVQPGAEVAGTTLVVEIVDEGHPGRLQSVSCPTDDASQGCATLSWALEEPPRIDLGGASVFLHPDLTLGSEAYSGPEQLALGVAVERFEGPVPAGVSTGEWTLDLPIIHLLARAPDGQRTPAQIEVRVSSR